MSTSVIGRPLVGGSVARVEDDRLLTGHGRFVDDVVLPGMLHAAFVRSPHAHAKILSIDVEGAKGCPGVVAVLTGADLARVARPLSFEADIAGYRPPEFEALTSDKARFAGDPVAMVVATSRHTAEDGCDRVNVAYEELAPVMTADAAFAPGAPVVFEALGDNVIHRDPPGKYEWGDLAGVFLRADRVISETFEQHRYGVAPMECRGGVADFDPGSGELTYHASTQNPHQIRRYLAEFLDHPQSRTRVLCGDVGGAFGSKWSIYREDVAIAAASKLLGRPVKWIEDRTEGLTVAGSAREETIHAEFAVTDDGTITGIRVAMTMDHGAYPALPPAPLFAALVRCTLLSALRVETYSFHATIAATNKNPYISYRGPGASETLIRERMIDVVARELDLDPVQVRRTNLLTNAEQPWKTPAGVTVHRAAARETLDMVVDGIDYADFRARQHEARGQGRYLGVGFANSVQPTPGFPDWWTCIGVATMEKDPTRIRLEPDGRVTLITSQMPHGQGHETTLAQVAAEELGVPFEHVRVITGDTQLTPHYQFGTGASRSAHMAGGSVQFASRELRRRVLECGAHMMQLAPEDIDVTDGVLHAKADADHALSFAEIATKVFMAPDELPDDLDKNLDVTYLYRPDNMGGGWSATTHACFVEVDVTLGTIEILRYVVAEECGRMINPAIVEGQVRGGVAQGIAGALLEECAYDERGRPLSTSFMSYKVPSSMDIPAVEILHLEVVDDAEVGFRGVGEGGAILAPAAVINAVEDALSPFGVRLTATPVTPTRVLEELGVLDQD